MEKKTMHIVTVTIKYDGIDIESAKIIGAYESVWDARSALKIIFHKICDKFGVKELNIFSYQEEDSFLLRTSDSAYAEIHIIGKITTIQTETEYLEIFDDKSIAFQGDLDNAQQVSSLAQITEKLNKNGNKKIELLMKNGAMCSRKTIKFADETDENGFGKFEVYSAVEETTQVLSLGELFDNTKTNLGAAINAGAIFMVLD